MGSGDSDGEHPPGAPRAAPPTPHAAHTAGRLAGTATRFATEPGMRRRETLAILCWLAGDLLSIPFHVLEFLCTRTRHRRDFQRALEEAAP